MEFSTYNESNLHKTLKLLYCSQVDGKTEVTLNGHVYDILSDNGEVIEIQVKNVSKLLKKSLDTIDKGYKIRIVHPVVITKRIILSDEEGNKISNRKSPIKGSIYDIFKELTGIYPVLLNTSFTLEILEINMIEERTRTKEPVQSDNNRRRFKKNWIKKNKRLDDIISRTIFSSKDDYISLLPKTLPDEFCAKDLQQELIKSPNLPVSASKQAHLIIWVLSRMGLIKESKVLNRNHYYKIVK